jgi:hypothetical protein
MYRYRMKARIAMNLIIKKGNIFKNDKLKKKRVIFEFPNPKTFKLNWVLIYYLKTIW